MIDVIGRLNMLGCKVEDVVTGQKGIAVSVVFDIDGEVRVIVAPPINASETLPQDIYFNALRLVIEDEDRVMDLPDFVFLSRERPPIRSVDASVNVQPDFSSEQET